MGIFSDNDPYIPLSSERIAREQFGAETIVLKGRHHFSGGDGVKEVPELLRFVDEAR